MELHQLRYFLAVVREGGFGAAAEAEDVAQPSLSLAIKKLEQSLDAVLFDRLGRGVRLTRAGEALVPRAETILRETRDARKSVESANDPDAGTLIVGAIPTILPYGLGARLGSFRESHPRVALDVRELVTEKLVDALRAGEVDVGILALPLKHDEIVVSELYREPLLVAMPPGHALSEDTPVAMGKLTGERMLLLRGGHCFRDDVLTACHRAKVEFSSVFESDQLASIFSMVASGFGVSLIPGFAAPWALGCTLKPVAPASVRRVGYALAPGHHATPLQKRFITWLRSQKWT